MDRVFGTIRRNVRTGTADRGPSAAVRRSVRLRIPAGGESWSAVGVRVASLAPSRCRAGGLHRSPAGSSLGIPTLGRRGGWRRLGSAAGHPGRSRGRRAAANPTRSAATTTSSSAGFSSRSPAVVGARASATAAMLGNRSAGDFASIFRQTRSSRESCPTAGTSDDGRGGSSLGIWRRIAVSEPQNGSAAGEHLVEHDAEAVDVGRRADLVRVALDLLRGHVRRRPDQPARAW